MANQKLIVAHRGCSSPWHENTVEAVQYAIDGGADMVEFDVRRTADGELIAHHDEVIGDSLLADIAYREAGRRSEALGYRIPRLSEILGISRGRILLDIELKASSTRASASFLKSRVLPGPKPTKAFWRPGAGNAEVTDLIKKIRVRGLCRNGSRCGSSRLRLLGT